MTLPSFFPVAPRRLRDDPAEIALWSDTARRARERSVRTGALVTSVCVAGGFAIAMAALPPSDTPGRVAHIFIEARYEEDWPTAWDAMCSAGRDLYRSYGDFTEWLAYVNDYYMHPTDVDVVPAGPSASRALTDSAWRTA